MNNFRKKKLKIKTSFPRTGFLRGMGSVFNIAGNYYQFDYSDSGAEADFKAISSDWETVGHDMQQILDSELTKAKSNPAD